MGVVLSNVISSNDYESVEDTGNTLLVWISDIKEPMFENERGMGHEQFMQKVGQLSYVLVMQLAILAASFFLSQLQKVEDVPFLHLNLYFPVCWLAALW